MGGERKFRTSEIHSPWRTVNGDQLDRLIKVDGDVRRIIIKCRARISEHIEARKRLKDVCDGDCGWCRFEKAKAFDQIGEVLKGVSEDDT